MSKLTLPIGVENYKEACKNYYVDKTLMINDLITKGEGKSILLTRPRRFGKSLALSMVDYYFNIKEDSISLFKDKHIFSCGEIVTNKINQYPVIHLNMKGIEYSTSSSIIDRTKDRIYILYRQFPELLNSDKLTTIEKNEFKEIYDKKASDTLLIASLERLTRFLYAHYQKKVVLLIDEYDAPIESSYENHCYDEVIRFFKPFYGDALKGNDYLYFALVSGVLQISKESLFSGLNNLLVSSIRSNFLSDYFGFNKKEVTDLLNTYEVNIDYKEVNEYYGGYILPNGETICNPWSILNFIEERKMKPYWANTGTNELLLSIINIENSQNELLDFLNNSSKKARYNPSISYKDMHENTGSSLSFLAQTGYLTLKEESDNYQDDLYEYLIPNKEIYNVFRQEIIGRTISDNNMETVLQLKKVILERKDDEISVILNKYLLSSLSTFDLGDERNYHNAITGLLSVLFDKYMVKNEVNTGTGRCDIIMIPKDINNVGIIIEIKYSKSVNKLSVSRLKKLANNAIDQIKKNNYQEMLEQFGCKSIIFYGFAFQKKTSIIVSETIQ